MPLELLVQSNMNSFSEQWEQAEMANIFEDEFTHLGNILVDELRNRTPRGVTRRLERSTKFDLFIQQGLEGAVDATLEIKQPARNTPAPGSLTPSQIYRPFISRGTIPHMPPSTAFFGWALIKLGVAIDVLPRVAFAIAKKIDIEGSKPNPYTAETVEFSILDIQQAADNIATNITLKLMDFENLPP